MLTRESFGLRRLVSAFPTTRQVSSFQSAVMPAHCYELCQVTAEGFPVLFFIKSCLLVFLFPSGFGVVKRFLWQWQTASAVALPAMRAWPRGGQHQMTHTVTAAKKRAARPPSKPGCCSKPQCACGRAPFHIVSVGRLHGGGLRPPPVRLNAPPSASSKLGGLHSPGAPAPKIHGELPGDGNHRFFRAARSCPGIAQHASPFFDQMAVGLPEHHPPGQFHQGGAQAHVTVFSDRQQALGVTAGAGSRHRDQYSCPPADGCQSRFQSPTSRSTMA